MNRTLFSVHFYLSWGFVAPYIMALVHVAAAQRFHFKGSLGEEIAYGSSGEHITHLGLVLAGCQSHMDSYRTSLHVELDQNRSQSMQHVVSRGTSALAAYNWFLVFIAMLVDNFLYPLSAIRFTFFSVYQLVWYSIPLEEWEDIQDRKIQEGCPKFTDLGGKYLYGRIGAPSKIAILGFLTRNLAQWRQPKKFDV